MPFGLFLTATATSPSWSTGVTFDAVAAPPRTAEVKYVKRPAVATRPNGWIVPVMPESGNALQSVVVPV